MTGAEQPDAASAPAAAPAPGEPDVAASPGVGAPDAEAAVRRPLWRNPFVIAFVIGVVTLTLLRPRMRYIPEPPPVLAAFPYAALVGRDGPAPSAQLSVAAFLPASAPDACGGVTALQKVWHRLRMGDVDARVVVVLVGDVTDPKRLARAAHDAGGERERWDWLAPADAPAAAVVAAAIDAAASQWAALPERRGVDPRARPGEATPAPCSAGDPGWITIVDADGQMRGLFDPRWTDIDAELYHRAQHVADPTRRSEVFPL